MGVWERKQREKEQRRNSILDAARDLLAQKGLKGTTIAEIAKEVELSKGTIYLYFQNKDEIIKTIIKEVLNQEKELVESCLHGEGTTIERLEKLAVIYKKDLLENPFKLKLLQYYENIISEQIPPSSIFEECVETENEIIELFQKIFEKGIEDGSIREDIDTKTTAIATILIIYSSLSTLIEKSSAIYAHHGSSTQDLLDELFTIIIRSLKKEK